MTITDRDLLLERKNRICGVQRIYRFAGNWGLSVINSPMAHSYPFAWEAAVLKDVDDDGNSHGLDYSTPLTSDVEVFMNDEDANKFIARARTYFKRRASRRITPAT